jgi:hypothetical protein
MQVLELRRLQALLQSLRAVSDVRLVLCRFFGSEVRHVSHDANDGQSRSDEVDGVEKEHGPAKRVFFTSNLRTYGSTNHQASIAPPSAYCALMLLSSNNASSSRPLLNVPGVWSISLESQDAIPSTGTDNTRPISCRIAPSAYCRRIYHSAKRQVEHVLRCVVFGRRDNGASRDISFMSLDY